MLSFYCWLFLTLFCVERDSVAAVGQRENAANHRLRWTPAQDSDNIATTRHYRSQRQHHEPATITITTIIIIIVPHHQQQQMSCCQQRQLRQLVRRCDWSAFTVSWFHIHVSQAHQSRRPRSLRSVYTPYHVAKPKKTLERIYYKLIRFNVFLGFATSLFLIDVERPG